MQHGGYSDNAAEPSAAHRSLNSAVATEHLHLGQTRDADGAKAPVKQDLTVQSCYTQVLT